MASIHILPPDLADKIAAGEVVERPASVVKELVENAIDAGATHIRVDIGGGGSGKIQVADNGMGMTLEEAKLAIQRHATSKISTLDDLFCIRTLGFRGEALPSIASVSHFVLETKPRSKETLEGTTVVVRGGELVEARSAGCPEGTRVTVSDLFYNTPARKKFLKSDGVETGHIDDTLVRLALGKMDCAFEFYLGGLKKWIAPVTKEPLQRLKTCLGDRFAEDAFSIMEETPEFKLHGWLLHPRQTASNGQSIYFYLNGRFLRDKVLQHALSEGFSDFLMKGQYPKAVLCLEMNPKLFDVNVHPSKREVRFVQPQIVHQFVAKSVRKGVQKVVYGGERTENGEQKTENGEPITENREPNIGSRFSALSFQFSDLSSPISDLRSQFSDLNVLGAIAQTYILCESSDHKLVLIDQHAAHERIGFEKLKNTLKNKEKMSQRLLVPITWEAIRNQSSLLRSHLDLLAEAGLEVEPFGGETFVVKSAPTLIPEKKIPQLLEKITEELETLETTTAMEKALELVLKTIACHTQVRAHDKLSVEEMTHLLKEMEEYHATHCPHGRPTSVEISLGQIEEWFKRK